ncbi:MAG: MerR family transcriptional regulator [Bulleidia sp.]
MSVHEVCTAFGVTRKRLYFYDKIDLLKPAARQGKQQEKMYTDHSAERLRQILIYQDAGLTLREIKMLMNDEAADADAIFLRAKNRLSANRNRIEIQMQKLDELIRKNREGKEE